MGIKTGDEMGKETDNEADNAATESPCNGRPGFVEMQAFGMLALFSRIEFADRAVVTHDSCPDLAALAFMLREFVGIE